jgi:hypothetical protein
VAALGGAPFWVAALWLRDIFPDEIFNAQCVFSVIAGSLPAGVYEDLR